MNPEKFELGEVGSFTVRNKPLELYNYMQKWAGVDLTPF